MSRSSASQKHKWRAYLEEPAITKAAPDPKTSEIGRLADGRKHTRRHVLRQLIEEQKRDEVTFMVGDVGRAYVDAKKQTGQRATTHRTTEDVIQRHAVEWQDPVGEEAVDRADLWREVLRLQTEDEEDVA